MTRGYSGLAGKTSLLAEQMAGFSVCHVGIHTFMCCHLHCGHGVRDVVINQEKDANWGVGTELAAPSELVVAGPLQETELRQLIRTWSFGGSGGGGSAWMATGERRRAPPVRLEKVCRLRGV